MVEKSELRNKILLCRKQISELQKERSILMGKWKQCLYHVQDAHKKKDLEKAANIRNKMVRMSKDIKCLESKISSRYLRQRDLQAEMVLLKANLGEL